MIKIGIVGVGGRTGTLFTEELKNASYVFGIGSNKKVEKIKKGEIFVCRSGEITQFKVNCITKDEIANLNIDYLFLATKNPVKPVLEEYLLKFGTHLPCIILPQNGFVAGEDALNTIKEIFGNIPESLQIIRVSLFNAVSGKEDKGRIVISYKLPVRIAFSVFYGEENTENLEEVFKSAHIDYVKVPQKFVKHMEYSKLFTNIIGLPSYSLGFDLLNGLKDENAFLEEIHALKEYVRFVKKRGNGFINFPHYPIRTFAKIVELVPPSLLLPVRTIIANTIVKLRGGVEKGNIDEVQYYIGAVVRMAKNFGIDTPTLERVLRRFYE